MKAGLLAVLLLLPLSIFATEDVPMPNIGGSQNRLEVVRCSGAFVLNTVQLEAALNEIDQSCLSIEDSRLYESCSSKVYKKHGLESKTAKLVIRENTASDDEDETFGLTIIENNQDIYKATVYGQLAIVTSKDRALNFQEYGTQKSDLFVQTGTLKAGLLNRAIGTSVLINILENRPVLYHFVNECIANWVD